MARKKKPPSPRGKLAKQQAKRLAYSCEDRAVRIARGEAYSKFIHGRAPKAIAQRGSRLYDRMVEEVAAEEKDIGRRYGKTSVPKHGEVRRLLKPALNNTPPTWENESTSLPPDATDQQKETALMRRRRQRLYEELAKVIFREFRCHQAGNLAIDDAMQFGMGAFCTDWNGTVDAPLCGFHYVSIKRVLIDCETRDDPLGESIRWNAYCLTMPLGDAKKNAEKWGNAGYEFKPSRTMLDGEDRETSLEELPTEFVRIVYVYVKGDSPHLRESKMGAELDEEVEDVGKDDVYDGRDRVLIMEARGEWDDTRGYHLIANMDPMYPNDAGETPLTLFSLDPDNEEFWGKPIYQRGHSLQVAIDWAVRYYQLNAYLTSKGAIGVVKGALDPSEQAKLLARTEPQPIVEFADQNKLNNGFKPLELGKPAQQLLETANVSVAAYDSIMAADLFSGIGKSHETAARAMLSSERAQLIIGKMADQYEDALALAMRKALMACRQKLTAEQVAAWVGVEFLYFEARVDEETGEEVLYSPLWNDQVNDIRSIRMEVDIRIKPRSVRFVSPEQRLQDMDRFGGKMSELLGKVLEAVGIGHPELAMEIAAKSNAYLRDYGNQLTLPNVDELMIDLKVAALPPMQPPGEMGAGGEDAQGTPGAAGPVSPAIHAMRNVMDRLNQGPETAPGEVGEQVRRAGA